MTISCDPIAYSRSGGQTLTGDEQIVASQSARWEAQLVLPPMDRETLLAWRGFVTSMRGRVGSVYMPLFEDARAPWAKDAFGRDQSPQRQFQEDRSRWRTGPYQKRPEIDTAIVVAVAAVARAQSTTILVAVSRAGKILPGQRFEIGLLDGYCHEIADVQTMGSYLQLEINPPLRQDVFGGEPLEFRDPKLRMRFASDREGLLNLERALVAQTTVNFVEAF